MLKANLDLLCRNYLKISSLTMEEKPETTARNDGEVVIDYILGEFKLTMWVPDELGRWLTVV